jgi:hypothetical protein
MGEPHIFCFSVGLFGPGAGHELGAGKRIIARRSWKAVSGRTPSPHRRRPGIGGVDAFAGGARAPGSAALAKETTGDACRTLGETSARAGGKNGVYVNNFVFVPRGG